MGRERERPVLLLLCGMATANDWLHSRHVIGKRPVL